MIENNISIWLEISLLISISYILIITFGYPILISFLCLFKTKKRNFVLTTPTVSLIISAHNEEKVISEKLDNSFSLDYPKEKLEIIVASDGSTDRTDEIVKGFHDKGVKLYTYDRIGKTGVQNKTVKMAQGQIIVFSDANANYRKDAVRMLVRNFSSDRIACVCGQLIYENPEIEDLNSAASAESSYWNYEKFLKSRESRLSSLLGVNGSIYAIRKSDYVELDPTLISDLVEPLELVKRKKKVMYEPDAISTEKASSTYTVEFDRKIRIITRSLLGLWSTRSLFNPFKFGFISIQFFLHKFCRYLIPFFLIITEVSLIFLSHKKFYLILFYLSVFFILLALYAKFNESDKTKFKLPSLCYYYLQVNFAVLLAWRNVINKTKITVWSTVRESD